MTASQTQAMGTMIGFDLTIPNAEEVRDFYASVVGWQPDPLDMGGYDNYFMKSPATGDIADLPPQWLAYIVVDDLEASLQRCADQGGTVLTGVKDGEGSSRYCVIRDPAGAVLALMQLGNNA